MIISKTTHVKLKKQYRKILYLYEAFDTSFVFTGMQGVKKDCIVHVDRHGTQLFCHYFQRPVDSLAMMNEFEAIVIESRANCISILDLKTHEWKRIPHWFMNEQSDQSFLWTFANTKYLVVVEHGRVNDNRIKLTYLRYPQSNPIYQEGKPLMYHRKPLLESQFYGCQGQWTYQHQIVKANNHSMIIWYKDRHDKIFEFRFYRKNSDCQTLSHLDDSNRWEYKTLTIDHSFPIIYNCNKLLLVVLEVFEIQKDKFMVCCQSNRQVSNQVIPQKNQPILINNYIVDIVKKTVTEAPHNLGKYHTFQIDRKLFGSCHMMRTFAFENGKALQTPVYYFSNKTLEKIFEETWVCSYLTKYAFPGYDEHVMLQCEYQNGHVNSFVCHYKKLIQHKEMEMFLMLEINDQFDHDLMQDVIEMICD